LAVNRVRLGIMAVLLALAACTSGPRPRPLSAGVTFDGRWDSNFHEMHLHQQGRKVWGTVSYKDGSITGQLDGDVLHFTWNQKENRQHGKGWLQMSSDGSKLEGRWGYDDSDDDGGRWWAERYDSGGATEETEPTTTETSPK
jgi:hypothetical protein